MVSWFARFFDVLGDTKNSSSSTGGRQDRIIAQQVQPRLQPRLHSFMFNGIQQDTLYWPTSSGETTASPAQRWQSERLPEESEGRFVLRQLAEALEQPGTLADYHFRIQGCCNVLWGLRRDEPELLDELEHLCLLDLQLIEAYPALISFDNQPAPGLHVEDCHRLVYFYERDGYLQDALLIALRGQRLNPQTMSQDVARLRERVARLEAEDASA